MRWNGKCRAWSAAIACKAVRGAVAVGLLAAVCVSGAPRLAAIELAARHRETRVNSEFRYAGMAFHGYANHMRRVIARTRVDLDGPRRLAIIDANSPFEWRPTAPQCRKAGAVRRGVLLIHGLTDSPYLMRDVGRFFLARCFLVRAIVLPGHGTVPGDLLQVRYQAWVQAARFGLVSFTNEVDALYVAGFSTGAALAVHLALQDEPIRGLILLSPAIKIKSSLGFMANWHKAVSWAASEKEWMDVAPDDDYAKYESFPFNAADQIYLLTQDLERMAEDKPLRVPMFMALSGDDMTVDAEDAIAFFKAQPHPASRLVLYTNRTPDERTDPRVERRRSAYPEQDVLNFSHLGIAVAPGNPHYGRRGDYHNCLHYLQRPQAWDACKIARRPVKYGEITEANLEHHIMRRLTYNPDFDRLMAAVQAFVAAVEP